MSFSEMEKLMNIILIKDKILIIENQRNLIKIFLILMIEILIIEDFIEEMIEMIEMIIEEMIEMIIVVLVIMKIEIKIEEEDLLLFLLSK